MNIAAGRCNGWGEGQRYFSMEEKELKKVRVLEGEMKGLRRNGAKERGMVVGQAGTRTLWQMLAPEQMSS